MVTNLVKDKRTTDSAQRNSYEHALTNLYASLPVETQTKMMVSIKALDSSYKTFVKANDGVDLRYMDHTKFNAMVTKKCGKTAKAEDSSSDKEKEPKKDDTKKDDTKKEE